MSPEFSHLVNVDRAHQADITVNAAPQERAAVAARLGLVGIDKLSCRFELMKVGSSCYAAKLHLQAKITQTCSITAEPFPAVLDEKSDVVFVPEAQQRPDLDPDAPDEIPYTGATIDLGEAAVEQLALAMEPFPQKPGAQLADDLPLVKPANDHPFAKLADWRPVNESPAPDGQGDDENER